MDAGEREKLAAEVEAAAEADRGAAAERAAAAAPAVRTPVSVRRDLATAPPPDLDRHVAELDLEEVWALVNPQMLYGKHLGLRGSVDKLAAAGDERLAKLERVVREVKDLAADGLMSARAVWRFFPARGRGERVEISVNGSRLGHWEFPRQRGRDGLCLADYLLDDDHLALFVTTATGTREQMLAWKDEGEYLKSHVLAALAIETAEAAAEWVHRRLRSEWGFADPGDLTPRDLFAARYRGRRYSFGYPACPDLGGQQLLFELLQPADIGVELTEGDMMDPEASVSALVVHHPEARYFAVGADASEPD
jgi:5-methyltetrahydrofolate--homocysteine methyltransferase